MINEFRREMIEHNFTYHAPTKDQIPKYEAIRAMGKQLAILIADTCPDCREASLALTGLENCVMWANAAIARHPKGEVEFVT